MVMEGRMPRPLNVRVDDAATQCLADCSDCRTICIQTIRHCLETGGEVAGERLISLLTDCADICETTRAYMLRASTAHAAVCHACAEVAERCAEACDAFPDDAQLRTCAEICRTAAASARRMGTVRNPA
jgi:hypothetical protein